MKTYCQPIEWTPCTDRSNLIDAFLSRLSHVYQDGPNIRAVLTAYLQQHAEIERTLCLLLDNFKLSTATGQQLDALGLVIGLPRTVCNVARVSDTARVAPGGFYTAAIDNGKVRVQLPANSPLADSDGKYRADKDAPLTVDIRWPDTRQLSGVATLYSEWLTPTGTPSSPGRTVALLDDEDRQIDFGDSRLGTGTKVLRVGIDDGLFYELKSDDQLYVAGSFTTCQPGATYQLQDYTFTDDEEYRRFLCALSFSLAFDGTLKQYERIVQYLFDGIDFDDPAQVGTTRVLLHGGGVVNIAVDRDLTDHEAIITELYKFVLPYFGSYGVQIYAGSDFFRFGDGKSVDEGMCQPFARSY